MPYAHSGNAAVTKLKYAITDSDLSFEVLDDSGWLDGSTGLFWACIDEGTLNEEKIKCVSKAGKVIAVWTDGVSADGRGGDGTTRKSHDANARVTHVWTAEEANEYAQHILDIDGAHGYPVPSSVVTTTGAQTLEDKTLKDPIFDPPLDIPTGNEITGGFHVDATELNLLSTQDVPEAEWQVRNIYIGSGPPSNTPGTPTGDAGDGSIYINKG